MLPPPRWQISPSVVNSQWSGISPLMRSLAITQPSQVCFDGLPQFCGFVELGLQFSDEARHLFLEGVVVLYHFLGADVAAGREDVALRCDFNGGDGFTEA